MKFFLLLLKRPLDSDGDGFSSRPKENFCHVEIPKETVAHLIGKDGSSIQEIEQQTDVSISFVDPGLLECAVFHYPITIFCIIN